MTKFDAHALSETAVNDLLRASGLHRLGMPKVVAGVLRTKATIDWAATSKFCALYIDVPIPTTVAVECARWLGVPYLVIRLRAINYNYDRLEYFGPLGKHLKSHTVYAHGDAISDLVAHDVNYLIDNFERLALIEIEKQRRAQVIEATWLVSSKIQQLLLEREEIDRKIFG